MTWLLTWLRGMRALAHKSLGAHLGPRQVFFAVFVGVIVGCTPFYGLHLTMCVALAWLLRLNLPSMYAAAHVSTPPLVPFLSFACVQVGERILRGQFLALHEADFAKMAEAQGGVHLMIRRFFLDWLVGGLLVGVVLGALLGAIAAAIAVARQRRVGAPIATAPEGAAEAPIDLAIAEASRRYQGAPRRMRFYARFKYRLDPCYRRIATLVPPGAHTVDLGTGLGMLPLVLAVLPGERTVLGVDWDEPKLAAGRLAAGPLALPGEGDREPRVRLEHGELRAFALPPCDVVTLVDVLHYYEPTEQRAIVARAALALRPGGRILVRDGDGKRGGGARWTRFVEWLAVRLGWNRGPRTHFLGATALAALLEEAGTAIGGLDVTVEPLAGQLHPGNVLLVAQVRI